MARVHRQHAVDGEVPADVAQEGDVVEPRQPLGVVDHRRVGLARAEGEELGERLLHSGLVALDILERQDLARLVLAGGIADLRRAAAHQHDGLAAGLLQPVQHHDGDEAADMQRGRRTIVPDIGDKLAFGGQLVEAGRVRALVDEPALGENS